MIDVWTCGETMVSLRADSPVGPATSWTTHVAGAESNVAIGLSRLGHRVGWYSRVGDDAFGRLVVRELRAEGVEAQVEVDPDRPTGFMFLSPTGVGAEVEYHRAGSAASALAGGAAEALRRARPRMVVVSGITAALGAAPAAALAEVIGVAAEVGAAVVLDVNHRARLWSRDKAAETLGALLGGVEVLIGSPDELDLWGTSPEELLEAGPREVVVKLGSAGARLISRDGAVEGPTTPVPVVDPVGAGDAFCAGYVSAMLDELGPAERLRRSNLMGAAAVGHRGDWEGLPRRATLLVAESADGADVTR